MYSEKNAFSKNGTLVNKSNTNLYFTKITIPNKYITYSSRLNNYSSENPYFYDFVITTQDSGAENACYVKYIPDAPIEVLEPKSFTGVIEISDINHNVVAVTSYVNGKSQNETTTSTFSNRGTDGCTSSTEIITTLCSAGGKHSPGETCGGPNGNDSYYEIVITVVCPLPYTEITVPSTLAGGPPDAGGGGASPDLISEGLFTLFTSVFSEDESMWWFNPLNTNEKNAIINFLNKDGKEGLQFAREALLSFRQGGDVDFLYKVIIDKSFTDNPCLTGVYEQLGQAATFQNYLQNFDADFSVADLKLSAGNVGSHAITSPPENFLIEIKFDVPILSTVPSLDVAGTFIHEMIHAEIFRKMMIAAKNGSLDPANMTAQQQINYVNNLKNNFPGIYDYYIKRYHPNWTHQMMAQHYLNIIIQVLKEYDNTQSNVVYEAIAWVGLMGQGTIHSTTGLPLNPTVAWQLIPQRERLEILNTYNNFKNNNPTCQ